MAENDNGDITVKIPSDYVELVADMLRAAATNLSLDTVTVKSAANVQYLNELANDINIASGT